MTAQQVSCPAGPSPCWSAPTRNTWNTWCARSPPYHAGAPVIIAFGVVGTYRLVGAALGPVEAIRARVALISSTDLAERVPVPPTRDEIAHLASTMNAMLARLERGRDAQRRLVGDASHELRSPWPPSRPPSKWRWAARN